MYLKFGDFFSKLFKFSDIFLKFGLSGKHTNLPHGFDKSADLLSKRQNHEEDFFQIMCAYQKVRTLREKMCIRIESLFVDNIFKLTIALACALHRSVTSRSNKWR